MKKLKTIAITLAALAIIASSQAGTVLPGDITGASSTFTTGDGLFTINGYSDSASTIPATLTSAGASNWYGIGADDALSGTETLKLQLAPGVGFSGFGDIYTRAVITISGFTSNPGLNVGANPGVISSGYSSGILSLSLDWNGSGARDFTLANLAASAGQTLTVNLDFATAPQWAITHLNYAPVPEPTSLALAVMGGLSLLVLKRRPRA